MAHSTRFRITTWPEVPLPAITRTAVPHGLRLDGDVICAPTPKRGEGWRVIEVPEEMYLREASTIDLDSPSQIARFVEEFGWLGIGAYVPRHRDHVGDEWTTQYLPASYELRRAVRSVAGSGAAPTWHGEHAFETLAEFKAGIHWLKDLRRIANQYAAGRLAEGPEWWDSGRTFERSFFGFGRPRGEPDSLEVLSTGLTMALRDFRVSVGVVEDGAAANPTLDTSAGPMPLFVALVAQLYSHVIEGAVYVTCASETCGGLFYRQRGRARHGQHRTTGTLYCSDTCARAQAQREYRRRNRKATT